MFPEKPKNDEKAKGRPRRPMVFVALAMIAVGFIGALATSNKSQTPPPPATVITSYEVHTYTQQTTTTTTSKTTTITTSSSQINLGDSKGDKRFAQYLASLLDSLQNMPLPAPASD